MKVRLTIGLLLLVCAQLVASANTPMPAENKDKLIKGLNAIRKEIAEKLQIANMNEVTYDSGMESIAQHIACQDAEKSGPDYLGIALPDQTTLEAMELVLSQATEEQLMNNVGEMKLASFVLPSQSKIGCAKFTEPCIIGEFQERPMASVAVCVMGPKGSFSRKDFEKGEPASKCANGKASNGLCNENPSDLPPGKASPNNQRSLANDASTVSSGTPSFEKLYVFAFIALFSFF